MTERTAADYRLDGIDRRTIYRLMNDARNTSAPAIAEGLNVSAGTIRNRIDRLEEHGIIRGYTTSVDFERADGRLTKLYVCTAPVSELESLAGEARTVSGVVNVRELTAGRRNLHVMAVGEDVADLRRIGRALAGLGVEIEDESLVNRESHDPYAPFGPEEEQRSRGPTDVISLAGDANVIEIPVRKDAPVVDRSIEEIASAGILDDETLVVAIERGGRVLTPRGGTVLQADDVVTLLFRGDAEAELEAFTADSRSVTP